MCFFKSRTRTLLRATALCLSASLLLTACGQQNNNNDILSPILPEDSPASNATSGEKMPDPVRSWWRTTPIRLWKVWCAAV